MIELPTERSVVTNYNPKLLILMGRPKQGKSSFVVALDAHLIRVLVECYNGFLVVKVQGCCMKEVGSV